mgnify:FL=1
MQEQSPSGHQPFDLSSIPTILSLKSSVVLIRHGKSGGNVLSAKLRANPNMHFKLPPGLEDSSFRLTSTGREQAIKTGKWLAARFPEGFDIILASPFQRARETAQLACLAAGWDIHKIRDEPLVQERCWGDIYSMNASERREVLEAFRKSPRDTRIPNGETLDETRARAHRFFEKVRSDFSGKQLLVFSHGEFIQEALADISGLSDHNRRYRVKNCQVFELSPWPESHKSGGGSDWLIRTSWPHRDMEGTWEDPKQSKMPGRPNLDSLDLGS